MRTRHFFVFALLLTLGSCKSIKQGESWKMVPEDKTIGLTLLYELPEAKLKEMLPKDQQPRITNGKGVLMLFLASTDSYYIGKRKYGQLGIAHLLIPLQKNLSVAETIGEKSQAIISIYISHFDFLWLSVTLKWILLVIVGLLIEEVSNRVI